LQIEDLMAGKDPRPPEEDEDLQVSKPSDPSNDIQGQADKKAVKATANKPAGQV